jgi:hypothetical protein
MALIKALRERNKKYVEPSIEYINNWTCARTVKSYSEYSTPTPQNEWHMFQENEIPR